MKKNKPRIKNTAAIKGRQHAFREGYTRGRDSAIYGSSGDFTGAETGRIRSDWLPQLKTSTFLLRNSFKRLAARSEEACRNNPYAKRVIDVLDMFVVGGGIRQFPAVVDASGNTIDKINSILIEDWKRANDEIYRCGSQRVTVYEGQSIEFKTMMSLGSFLRQEIAGKSDSILRRAFTIIKPTTLDFSKDTFDFGDIYKKPIKDQTILGQNMNAFFEPKSFNIEGYDSPISASQMSLFYRTIEAEQRLGIPWLTPVITKLWDIEQLFGDKLLQSRQLTRMGIWEKKAAKNAMSKLLKSEDGEEDEAVTLERLSTYYSDEEPKPIKFDDTLDQSFIPLIKVALHAVAVGMGFSYGRMTTDLEGANFAGGRINIIGDTKYFNSLFRHFAKCACQSLWNKFIEFEFMAGRVGTISFNEYLSDKWRYSQCYHLPEGEQWVDPLKDAQAQDLLYKTGQVTLQQLCAMKGQDYKAIIKQREKEKQELTDAGLEELLPSNDGGIKTEDKPDQGGPDINSFSGKEEKE
ncbi:MAG: phage portal protein [Ignavibacteria bacterium]|nr:phage portal protein [Ignavibacteria bacterium]